MWRGEEGRMPDVDEVFGGGRERGAWSRRGQDGNVFGLVALVSGRRRESWGEKEPEGKGGMR